MQQAGMHELGALQCAARDHPNATCATVLMGVVMALAEDVGANAPTGTKSIWILRPGFLITMILLFVAVLLLIWYAVGVRNKTALTNDVQGLPAGRYFTPATLVAQMKNASTENAARVYLVGAYDLAQDSGQSCAARGTTTPQQLEQIFANYLKLHPELTKADRTAAGVAAQAFAEYWPCQKR